MMPSTVQAAVQRTSMTRPLRAPKANSIDGSRMKPSISTRNQ